MHMYRSSKVFKGIAIGAASLALIWLAVVVGLANIARSHPAQAFAFRDFNDARLMGRHSEMILVSSQNPLAISKATKLAKAALKRDPTVVSAIRTLAAVHELKAERVSALRLMRYSEAMSRRDFPTHFWLIDYEANQNNVAKALDHYDAALRTSSAAEPILIPILLDALDSTDLLRPLAKVLSRKPAWAMKFVSRAISESKSSEKLLELAFLLRAQNFEIDPEPLEVLMNRAVSDNLYAEALQLSRRPAQSFGIYNHEFDQEPKYAPFDWALTADDDLGSEILIEENSPDRHRLLLYGSSGRSGIVAKQLLLLTPGKYVLRATVSQVPQALPDRPFISVGCSGKEGSLLTKTNFPATPNKPNRLYAVVNIPSQNCRAQWLYISVRASNRIGGTQSFIHNASIRRWTLDD